jgi:hypothetical protein
MTDATKRIIVFYARRRTVAAAFISIATLAPPPAAAANSVAKPDFSGLWGRNSWDFEQPPSGPGPIMNRMRRPDGASLGRLLVGDYTNLILKPQAAERVKALGEISLGGYTYADPANQCFPHPMPYILAYNFEMQMLQQPGEITILYRYDHQVRRVRMNQPHPEPVAPSWYGDSVGHYEGGDLVIDTIGVKTGPLSIVDIYGTPHSNALHLVERYHLIDGEHARQAVEKHERDQNFISPNLGTPSIDLAYKGPGLQVQITVEDDNVFTAPWTALVTYRRPQGGWVEDVCAENLNQYGRAVAAPRSDQPDF